MDSTEIIEKIRAEIKIRLSANGAFDEEGDSAWHYDQGLNDAYNYILSVLSDLEKEEKPFKEPIDGVLYAAACGIKNNGQIEKSEKPSDGLEEEINLAWEKLEKDYSPSALDKTLIIVSGLVGEKQFSNITRHFYELGRQSKPVLSDDLEKAAREYAMDDFYNGYSSGSIIEDTMKNFKAGAEWGRRNLLQEIADGKTHPVDGITAAWLDNTDE